jgi:PadR family transcriptional regulator PadR
MRNDVLNMLASSNDAFANWTVQVRKGLLELCILNALEKEKQYGYGLIKILSAFPVLGITEGTLYSNLARLRAKGLVNTRFEGSTEGPTRKYYMLTLYGSDIVNSMNEYFGDLHLVCHDLQTGPE